MNAFRISALCAAIVLAMSMSACGGGGSDQAADTTDTAAEPMADQSMTQLPDTTAEEVWAFLEDEDYRDEWEMWPGKTALYEGQEPHGMLLSTYLNETALEALNANAGTMPAGSVIIKDNYMPDSTLAAVTVMHKVQGYNPEHNDWYWAKFGPDGAVEVSGKVGGCQSCHGARADNDYVMTASLSGM